MMKLSDHLLPLEETMSIDKRQVLMRERPFTSRLEVFAESSYPVSEQLHDMLDAARQHYVIPWEEFVARTHVWVRAYFVEDLGRGDEVFGPRSTDSAQFNEKFTSKFASTAEFDRWLAGTEYNRRLAAVRNAEYDEVHKPLLQMVQRYADDYGMWGSQLRLECIPFGNGFAKRVPIVEQQWIDLQAIVLAEFGATLMKERFHRLPALDTHPIAWDRFFRPGTTWRDITTNKRISISQLDEEYRKVEKSIDRWKTKTRQIDGRPFVRLDDYIAWRGRKVRGDLNDARVLNKGIVQQQWNDFVCGGDAAELKAKTPICLEMIELPFDTGQYDYDSRWREEVQSRNASAEGILAMAQSLSPRQQQILDALDGRALTADDLANEIGCGRRTLFHRNGIKELCQIRLVRNYGPYGGYYRPEAPPTNQTTSGHR